MRNPGGYACISGPDGTREADTTTCGHCQKVTFVKAGRRADDDDVGGGCWMCRRFICGKCVDKGICEPFEKTLERAERSNALYGALR